MSISRSLVRRRPFRLSFARLLIYLTLAGGAALTMVPFAWTVSTALKTTQQALTHPPVWIPNPVVWQNFATALTAVPFHIYYRNSLVVAVLSIVGQVISSALVAYGFARIRFAGRDVLFMVVLSTLMVPFQVLIIPRFILFKYLGWLDTLKPLIVPQFFGGAFFIFLLRQYIMGIPLELDDAAKIDGCGHFDIFLRIILPLTKPALGAVAVFEFLNSWDDFLGPLIILNSSSKYTVPLGLATFRTEFFTEWNLFMAASLVAMVLPLAVFFVAQKHFIQGVALTGSGGVKG